MAQSKLVLIRGNPAPFSLSDGHTQQYNFTETLRDEAVDWKECWLGLILPRSGALQRAHLNKKGEYELHHNERRNTNLL